MNIQRIYKIPPIHATVDDPNVSDDFIKTLCGKWLDVDNFKVVTGEVTCLKCLESWDNQEEG